MVAGQIYQFIQCNFEARGVSTYTQQTNGEVAKQIPGYDDSYTLLTCGAIHDKCFDICRVTQVNYCSGYYIRRKHARQPRLPKWHHSKQKTITLQQWREISMIMDYGYRCLIAIDRCCRTMEVYPCQLYLMDRRMMKTTSPLATYHQLEDLASIVAVSTSM